MDRDDDLVVYIPFELLLKKDYYQLLVIEQQVVLINKKIEDLRRQCR